MDTFLEGVDAVRLPCTLAVLVPATVVVLVAGRRGVVAVAGFLVGATLVAWTRFTGAWFDEPGTAASIGLGAVFAVAIAAIHLAGARRPEVVGPSAVAVGGITAWLWRPCVGARLGDILNNAPDSPASELLPTLAYLLGAASVAVVVAAAPIASPRLQVIRDHRSTTRLATLVGLSLGLAIAAGVYDDLVAELLRRSSI